MIEYLKDKGVDEELVRKCIYEGIIYEDSRFHSAIFVGFDEQGKPAHASYRSTNGSGLKGDLRGSNKAYSFRIEQKSGDKVRVFESAIDLLSYASICKLKDCEEELGSLISTSGIYSSKNEEYKLPMALEAYLERHPETKTVILQLDNDEAGLKAATEIRSKLKSKQ